MPVATVFFLPPWKGDWNPQRGGGTATAGRGRERGCATEPAWGLVGRAGETEGFLVLCKHR